MNWRKIEIVLFRVAIAAILVLIVGGGLAAETLYGRGLALLAIGVILIIHGFHYTGRPTEVRLVDAVRVARDRSGVWWLPLIGVAIAFFGASVFAMADGATSLEQFLSILLVFALYSRVKESLISGAAQQSATEPAA